MRVNMRHWRTGLTPTPFCNFDAEDGSGGGAPPAPPAPPQPPRQPVVDDPTPGKETFSREYVGELRAENKGWRLKVDETRKKAEAAERERDEAKAAAEQAKKDADTAAQAKAQEAQAKASERIMRAELRTIALKAGMIDLDGLKLADLSGLKLNDKDEVEGGDDLIAKLKEAKPYLFGAATGTSNTNTPPPKPGEKPKSVKEMDGKEYAAAKAAAMKA